MGYVFKISCCNAKPKFESWFMEATLIPNFHYIEIKDDYSDLNDKLEYYIENLDKLKKKFLQMLIIMLISLEIKNDEKIISLLVMENYLVCLVKKNH